MCQLPPCGHCRQPYDTVSFSQWCLMRGGFLNSEKVDLAPISATEHVERNHISEPISTIWFIYVQILFDHIGEDCFFTACLLNDNDCDVFCDIEAALFGSFRSFTTFLSIWLLSFFIEHYNVPWKMTLHFMLIYRFQPMVFRVNSHDIPTRHHDFPQASVLFVFVELQ